MLSSPTTAPTTPEVSPSPAARIRRRLPSVLRAGPFSASAPSLLAEPDRPARQTRRAVQRLVQLASRSANLRCISTAAVGSGPTCPSHLGFSRSSTTLVPEIPCEDALFHSPGSSRWHIVASMLTRDLRRTPPWPQGRPSSRTRRHSVPVDANLSRIQAALIQPTTIAEVPGDGDPRRGTGCGHVDSLRRRTGHGGGCSTTRAGEPTWHRESTTR